MDIIAHALWGLIIFHKLNPWLVIFFSIFPDILAFSIDSVRIIFVEKRFTPKKMMARKFPPYVVEIYNYTHSLILTAVLFIILFFTFRTASYYILPWILHILVDIPLHPKEFFGTPFMYPFSNYKFNGYHWIKLPALLANYALLALVAYLVFIH